jgi:hypothetical protein
MSRQAFTVGDTLGSSNPTYFLRQTVSGQSGSLDLAIISQRVEGVRSYAGQTITVLGWARRSSGSGNMSVETLQNFGTGGSPSSEVFITPQTVTLTSSWAPFALTFSVPSIAGKTLGTNGNDFFQLNFWTSAGSGRNARSNSLGIQTIGVDLWGVHIKVGTHTTAATDLYKQPELGPELARCRRYFLRLNAGGRIGVGGWNSSTSADIAVNFPVEMRIVPAGSASAMGRLLDYGVGWHVITAVGFGETTSFMANVGATVASSAAAQGDAAALGGGGGADYSYSFDAEL